LKIYFSHGSVATQLKCGGIFNNYIIANCPQYVSVKECLRAKAATAFSAS